MTPRCRAFAPALAAVLVMLGPRSVAAVEQACGSPTVEADAAVVSRFPELLERVRAELARPDIDACARVDLHATEDTIQVSVTLPDGRTATRPVHRYEDIVPTLQALLLVPQSPGPLASPAAPKASALPRRAAPPAPLRLLRRNSDRAAPLAAPLEPRSLGFELSLQGGPRMGENQLAIGLGALSFLEVHGWLFGFTSRVDRYQVLLNGDPEMGLELGVLAGKRFHFRDFALDLDLGPAVAMKGLALSSTEVAEVNRDASRPMPLPLPEDPGTGPVPRLLLGVRAGFTPRDVLRSFAGIEASLGPARADDNPNPDSSKFPVFALGLVLGGTVGTR